MLEELAFLLIIEKEKFEPLILRKTDKPFMNSPIGFQKSGFKAEVLLKSVKLYILTWETGDWLALGADLKWTLQELPFLLLPG